MNFALLFMPSISLHVHTLNDEKFGMAKVKVNFI